MNKQTEELIRLVKAERICSSLEPDGPFDRHAERLFLLSKLYDLEKKKESRSPKDKK